MANQYFENNRDLKQDLKELTCWCGAKKLTFVTDSGVFSRSEIDDASLMLVRKIPPLSGRVLDLGCGYGFIGIYAAAANPGISLTQTDINERAAELCALNCRNNGIDSDVRTGDGLSAVSGEFDFILLNPPIHAGKEAVFRLLGDSMARLSGPGVLYIVVRKKHGASSMIRFLDSLGETETVARDDGIMVISCRNKEQ